jgi:hypothetical protein
MICNNCERIIWYWNKWRNYPFKIFTKDGYKVSDKTYHVCSENCLEELKIKFNAELVQARF